MSTYAAFFNSQQAEIQADSSYGAQLKAVAHFNPRKSQKHLVYVVLVSRDNVSAVTHTADF